MGFGHSELDVSAGRRDLGRPGLALVVLSVVELRPRALPPTALTSISRSTRPWHRSPRPGLVDTIAEANHYTLMLDPRYATTVARRISDPASWPDP